LFSQFLHYFKGSLILSAIGFALAATYGWNDSHALTATLGMLWIVFILVILEISLSFDNAVVNAAVLKDMDALWQKRFLTWGMLFAVFGTRVLFPLAIVGFTAGLGPWEAIHLSLNEPAKYEEIVSHAHIAIAGFGGAFLLMVGFSFFFDSEKNVHWLSWLEDKLQIFASIKAAEIGMLLLILLGIAKMLPAADAMTFLTSGLIGLISFIAVEGLGSFMESREAQRSLTGAVARSGLGAFLYLNVLDASFSLDGVIGAFALSNNMIIIAIGLSIGAIFVRSITMLLVEKGTLAEYRYLEHGAFWAIVALGIIMLASAKVEIPEAITGLIGAAMIGAAVWWSMRHQKLDV
jgi:uncharacterized protein